MIWFTATAPMMPGGPWVAAVVMPKLSAKGAWHVGYMQVADNARNIGYYNDPTDPALASATLTVE
jgi:hypothetical protein